LYSNVERSEDYKHRLLDFIQAEYSIEPVNIIPAKRGFYGETWRLDAVSISYFVKLVYPILHKPVYESSFPVIQHLCDHRIDFIGHIVKTKNGKLSIEFDGAILGVFNWIDGENIQNESTKSHEYQLLAKIYAVPAARVFIPCEDFSDKYANMFFEQWNMLEDKRLLSLLEDNRPKIEHRAERLRKFSQVCKGDRSGFVITHGDAGGNFMVSGDRQYIVDWDNPILAPPERDAWFCMHWDWAMEAFHNALRHNGIVYNLRPERLAYNCYHMFFFYLYVQIAARTYFDRIEEFIGGWIEESFRYADANL
jgi:hypothetical protein